MKTLLCTTLLFLVPLASATLVNAPARPGQSDEFVKKFRAAVKTKDTDAMNKLVKGDEEDALRHAVSICEQVAETPTPELETEVDYMRRAWKAVYKSDFVGEMYEYLSLLKPALKRQRASARLRFDKAMEDYEIAAKEKSDEGLATAGLEFSGLASLLEDIGDMYWSSECWAMFALCFEEETRGKRADLKKACEGWQKVATMRERISLEDSLQGRAKERFEKLEYDGYGDPSKGPAARAAAKAEAESVNSFPVTTTFAVMEDLDKIIRPSYAIDAVYQTWPPVQIVGGPGSSTKFPYLEQTLNVIRTAAVQAGVDVDGDREADLDVPTSGNISPVEVTIGEGDERREWAFLVQVGKEDDLFQGFRYNLNFATSTFMTMYIAPAASVVGMIGETRIQVIDDNMDGTYGSPPFIINAFGLREGTYDAMIDSVLVGKEKSARPWSDLLNIEGQWHRMEPSRGGTEFTVTPTSMESGTVKLDFKGLKPDWCIIQGAEEINSNVLIDLAPNGKKGTEVPVGRYKFLTGRVSKGKRQQMAKAAMLPGEGMPGWTVEAGKTITISMGAPFGFDFDVTQTDSSVTALGASLVVTGQGGETYQRFWNCVPAPDMLVRAEGKKKGSKGAKMKPAMSQEEIIDKDNNTLYAWVPYNGTAPKKSSGDMEVQLYEKKNKLFGKIESDWYK